MLLLALKLYFIVGEMVMLGVLYAPSVQREIAGEPLPSALLSTLVVGVFWPVAAVIVGVGMIASLMRGK